MITKIEAWKTSDGQQHDTIDAASRHELKCFLTKRVPEGLAEQVIQSIEDAPSDFSVIVGDFIERVLTRKKLRDQLAYAKAS